MIGRIALVAISAIATNCDGPIDSIDSIDSIRPAQIITIPEDYNVQFDARPGDTVIEIMNLSSGRTIDELIVKCENSGGELIYNPFTWIYSCEGIDF